MRTSRLLAAVPVLLGLTVVAGCGPSVPEGYLETTQGQLRLVVPEGWVAGETSGDVDGGAGTGGAGTTRGAGR